MIRSTCNCLCTSFFVSLAIVVGAINPKDKFATCMPCGTLHPGHCKCDNTDRSVAICTRFLQFTKTLPVGTLFAFVVRFESTPDVKIFYKCLASQGDGGMASVNVVNGIPKFDVTDVISDVGLVDSHLSWMVVPWMLQDAGG